MHFAGQVTLFIIHLDILCHEVGLNKVDHLERYEERDRDEVHQSYKPDANVEKALSDHVCFVVRFERIEVPGLPSAILSPDTQDARAKDSEGKLDAHRKEHKLVEHFGIFGALGDATGAIFHDLGVMASENAQTCNPLGVPE